MITVKYYIPNISCQHCVNTIQRELSALEGVKTVLADVNSKEVTVTFDPPANEEAIKELLAEINYPVEHLQ